MKLKGNKFFLFDDSLKINIYFIAKAIFRPLLVLFYNLILLFGKRLPAPKKYKVSVCAIFKNEAKYLKEWIEFNRLVGIDHFYLYNNFSSDNYTEVLEKYLIEGIVTLIDWPIPQGQNSAYIDCIKKFSNESEWIAFIDIDEFIVPNESDNVYDFLKPFQKKHPTVIVYWKLFGTSGLTERDTKRSVVRDFVLAWPKYTNIGKCFYNTAFGFDEKYRKNQNLVHSFWGKKGSINVPPVDCFGRLLVGNNTPRGKKVFPIQINHYFTKSFEEYVAKSSRGDAYFAVNPRTLEYFYEHEMKATSPDYCAYKYLIKLHNSLKP